MTWQQRLNASGAHVRQLSHGIAESGRCRPVQVRKRRKRAVASLASLREQSTRTAPSHAPVICTQAPIPELGFTLSAIGCSSICNIPLQISPVSCRISFSCISMLFLRPGAAMPAFVAVCCRWWRLHAYCTAWRSDTEHRLQLPGRTSADRRPAKETLTYMNLG